MKHYVIVNDWANENESLADEKQYAKEHGFTIYDDCETVFDAGEEGYYRDNHTNLYIQMI